MKFNTIIWDLDGTLMDTLQDLMNSVNYALDKHGMPVRTYKEIRSFVGNGVKRLLELSVPDGLNNPSFEEVFADFKTHYIVHCQDQTGLYEGIADTLKVLKARGIRMAVVSNKLQSGVTELFESQVRTVGKEDKICLGDSEVDLATARNSGLPCISVLWGFRDQVFLKEQGAQIFVEKPQQIIDYTKIL